jgi:prophage antirepressor-like protein
MLGPRMVVDPATTEPALLTEAGLYSLILTSRSPRAKAVKRWVTHEVLPAIRRTARMSWMRKRFVTGELSPRWSSNARTYL